MSVIQSIRDKYARWAVVAIALSLLGFILMDAFAGRTNILGGNSTTVGKINGEEIDVQEFEQKVKAQEAMAQQQGYNLGEEGRQQIIESVWNSEIDQALLEDEFEKLGLTVGKKEINDMLFGDNPPADLKQNFSDPATGVYNPQQVQQYFATLRKSGTPEQKAQMNQYLASLELQRMNEKYVSLLSNSTYFAKWFVEKQNVDNSLIANVSYVGIPYSSVSDSAVKVSDEEIQDYINERKEEFKQEDETRSINYIMFNAAPTATDSAAVKNQIQTLKSEFASASDNAAFLSRNGSSIPLFDAYVAKSKIQVPAKDSILSLPVGGVYGPYADGNSLVLAKVVDVKTLPDSVKVRHILLGTSNPQTGQMLMPDSVAKAKADSIAAAIRSGANFDTLEARYSTDVAAHQQQGVMTFSSTDIQGENFAQEFGQFILFDGKPGDKKVVKTNFGYHYIEILNYINPEPHYKVAYMAKPIVASDETDNTASNAATQFAGDSRDLSAFNNNFDKNLRTKGYNKLVAQEIRPNDYAIPGIGNSRQLVKAVFNADEGDVLEPIRVGDAYVVAAVTDVTEPGTVSVAKARSAVEPILRNRKKAAQIKQKLGNISTLEAATAATGQPVQQVDSLSFAGGRNAALGYELKVVGAAFNPANKGKVVPEALAGQAGVYVLRVNNVGAVPVAAANVEEQRNMLEMQARQTMMYRSPTQALRKSAEIKDYRSKFY